MSNQESDQLPGEPDAAYARYLAYRSLGPDRSIEKAYKATNGAEKPYVSGQWKRDAVTYRWAVRASQWDIDRLNELGKTVIANFYEALTILSRKAIAAVDDQAFKPTSHAEVLSVITLLGSYISPESINQWAESNLDSDASAASESEPTYDEF